MKSFRILWVWSELLAIISQIITKTSEFLEVEAFANIQIADIMEIRQLFQ